MPHPHGIWHGIEVELGSIKGGCGAVVDGWEHDGSDWICGCMETSKQFKLKTQRNLKSATSFQPGKFKQKVREFLTSYDAVILWSRMSTK